MTTPHKHAALIKAWAEGAEIEWRLTEGYEWKELPSTTPPLDVIRQYRIKPEKEYPKSSLTYDDLCKIWNAALNIPTNEGAATVALRLCANEAVKRYVKENGE